VEWLFEEMGKDLAKVENEGRDAIAVARASGSASVAAWIEMRRAKQVISCLFRDMIAAKLLFDVYC
jgi:hypothetical protein